MFTSQILQKNKLQTVVLLHGLFASAGFWLPALRCLSNHRIVLLNVDYSRYFVAADGLAALEEFLRHPTLGLDDNVRIIGHSFCSVLVASLALPAAQRYHLCPIFLREHADVPAFAAEVNTRTPKFATAQLDTLTQLELALRLAQDVDLGVVSTRGDCFLIPDADLFFRYGAVPAGAARRAYRGDHFKAAEALAPLFTNRFFSI